jgi:hypothetical protein
VKTTQKKSAKRRTTGAKASPSRKRKTPSHRPRRQPAAAASQPVEEQVELGTPAVYEIRPVEIAVPDGGPELVEHELPPEGIATLPEAEYAERVPPPPPERPVPARRRAIFFDVENTSRAEHIARMLAHLAIDRAAARTDFVAVGNWRVIGHETARLLAQRGAQLVHSAPSVGIRDWSDLRIAVAAGVWLASAGPGDVIEIVSDDRAFDAVGDVAAGLGLVYRRMSHRALAGTPREPVPAEAAAHEPRGRGRRRGRRRGWHERPAAASPAQPVVAFAPVAAPPEPVQVAATNGSVAAPGPTGEPHTAPHDEIVGVAQELIQRSASGSVTIDTLANALKSRGFRRTPGSPRLITRLRRIRELQISRTGLITLVDGGRRAAVEPEPPGSDGEPAPEMLAPVTAPAVVEPAEFVDDDDNIGNRLDFVPRTPHPSEAPPPPQRRPRRGGRRRRGGHHRSPHTAAS